MSRLLGGVAYSILFTSFEAWLVAEAEVCASDTWSADCWRFRELEMRCLTAGACSGGRSPADAAPLIIAPIWLPSNY